MCRIRLHCVALALILLGQVAGAQVSADKSVEVIVTAPTANIPKILKFVIHYDDLDISTSAGATALLDRLSTFAIQVCTKRQAREFPKLPAQKYEKCRRDAVTDVVQRLDAPEVTRVFSAAGK
jgi:UrcA family protein